MRERLGPRPAASSRRKQWRQVAWPRGRVVLNAAHARNILGDDAECPSFLLRSDGPPKMHDTVRDDDIRFDRARPLLPAQVGEQSIADQAVAILLQVLASGGAAKAS